MQRCPCGEAREEPSPGLVFPDFSLVFPNCSLFAYLVCMKVNVRHLRRMLSHLSEKTGESLDRSGLRNMASEIGGISEDYLYKKIFYEIRDLSDDHELSLRDAQLNSVARYLGFPHAAGMVAFFERPANEQLQSLLGNYYLYVRQNSSRGLVFQSPVTILETGEKLLMRMTGPSLVYEGEPEIRQGCLFVHLVSREYKSFYHVYKVGTRRSPAVIQGIFTGVSTAFDPIGGRSVLVRVELPLSDMQNHAFTLDELAQAPDANKQRLARYFREYGKNNLAINRVISFASDDLDEE